MIVPLELGKSSRCKFVCFFSYLLIKAFFFPFFKSGFRLHCEAGTLEENKTVAHINYSNGQKSDAFMAPDKKRSHQFSKNYLSALSLIEPTVAHVFCSESRHSKELLNVSHIYLMVVLAVLFLFIDRTVLQA